MVGLGQNDTPNKKSHLHPNRRFDYFPENPNGEPHTSQAIVVRFIIYIQIMSDCYAIWLIKKESW